MADTTADEDVPPLEDLSELLEKANLMRGGISDTQNGCKSKTDQEIVTKVEASCPVDESKKSARNTAQIKSGSQSKQEFGGLKKGFLFSNTKSPKKKTPEKPLKTDKDDIPLIKPKQQEQEQWKMPEVQEAMKTSQVFAQNKDWVTEDLLSKVMNNETLAKRLSDPVFMQGVTDFQKNPQAAMKKYKNNPEMKKFLTEFCGIMGKHFEGLSTSQPAAKAEPVKQTSSAADISVRSSTNASQATAEDERRMQEILENPAIREVLVDPQIQSLIAALRNNPHQAQSMLREANTEQQKKIKKLVDVGLLQFQR